MMPPSDAELATQALVEEGKYRFPSFSSSDAVTLVSILTYIEGFPHMNLATSSTRGCPCESDLDHLRDTSKERDSLSRFRRLQDTPCLRAQWVT